MIEDILQYTYPYLEKKLSCRIKKGSFSLCPICKIGSTLRFNRLSKTPIVCNNPKCRFSGDLYDLIRKVEGNECNNNEIDLFLQKYLDLDLVTQETLTNILEKYKNLEFDLVPIAKDSKFPIEKDWTNKSHKEKEEWEKWLETGINIGVKTGKTSQITVIDSNPHYNSFLR